MDIYCSCNFIDRKFINYHSLLIDIIYIFLFLLLRFGKFIQCQKNHGFLEQEHIHRNLFLRLLRLIYEFPIQSYDHWLVFFLFIHQSFVDRFISFISC